MFFDYFFSLVFIAFSLSFTRQFFYFRFIFPDDSAQYFNIERVSFIRSAYVYFLDIVRLGDIGRPALVVYILDYTQSIKSCEVFGDRDVATRWKTAQTITNHVRYLIENIKYYFFPIVWLNSIASNFKRNKMKFIIFEITKPEIHWIFNYFATFKF